MIRDGILTCAQKLTISHVNLPHGTKNDKVKTDMLSKYRLTAGESVELVMKSKIGIVITQVKQFLNVFLFGRCGITHSPTDPRGLGVKKN